MFGAIQRRDSLAVRSLTFSIPWSVQGPVGVAITPRGLHVCTCIAQVISRFSHQFFDKTYLNQYVEEISGAICESPYGCEFRLG